MPDLPQNGLKMSIRFKAVLICLVLFLIGISIISSFQFNESKTILKDRILYDLTALVNARKDIVINLLDGYINNTIVSSSRRSPRGYLVRIAQNIPEEPNSTAFDTKSAAFNTLKDAKKSDPSIRSIDVMDINGIVRISSDKKNLGKDFSKSDSFVKGQQGIYVGDLYLKDGKFRLDTAVPQYNPNKGGSKQLVGVFKVSYDVSKIIEFMVDYRGMGKTGEIYLCKRMGNDVVIISPLRYQPDAAFKVKVPYSSDRASASKAALNKGSGIMIGSDYQGSKVLAAYAYLPKVDWGMVVKIDLKEAFIPIKNLMWKITFTALLIFIFTSIVVIFLSDFFVRPIKKLSNMANEIANGNLDSRVEIHSQDEIEELAVSLNVMAKNLKTMIDELDDFTYIVSHDLKEPLRSIDAYSKFVADDYRDKIDDKGRHYLNRIRVNAERMKKLIEDLLEISRLKKKGNTIEQVPVGEIISEALIRLEYAIKQKNVQVNLRGPMPTIYCDRLRIGEVFVNLLSNAIKFNDKPKPLIEIGFNENKDYTRFYVKDNGPGIEKQYYEKIFEPFQRLVKREEAEGTGAGLAIVRQIIRMHKGEIWVESKINEGATFYFSIPKDKEKIFEKKLPAEIFTAKNIK